MAQSAAVVGAGMLGLSTARILQQHGIGVTSTTGHHLAAGAPWHNAGWPTPRSPRRCPNPRCSPTGVKPVLSPSSRVDVPLRPDPRLRRFLAGFARHGTARRGGLSGPTLDIGVVAIHDTT